ncbi:MAG: GTP diphosphokinase [Succinivibrio dextrinosolvens]|uniref:GTP diphosphokinase n=1 Tax=Succinivibrio sp. TaxID=2053619 RepID=UPI0025E4868C|nr:GTP diphosphokinase [Succinivibrio sp.]MBQ9220188.1 GTP diphosphokinase [Succinivibrio sp.]MDY6416970.1 GTP diphosphokinase [Succinivibrio dextrinosolvens]MDY6419284.1 GTP diphosphokinase [Succinivibrio dextrinosolvens]MDY6471113.1 GTP diphosphokinase [Succinivibrio dextrinosolvens]
MVAIRQTHNASFDFAKWVEALELSAEYKDAISKTNEFVLRCIRKTEVEEDFVNPDDLVARFNHISSEIVGILMTLNMDLPSLEVSILYPAYESGFIKLDDIREEFGPKITTLLLAVKDMEAIRSLQTLTSSNATEEQVDRVRRMLLAMVKDVRAVVVKLAERIAVIRAAKEESPESRYLIAKEVSNVYAPLANRLGIGQLKWELEDLAFKFLHPDTYKEIASDLGERRVDREKYIENFVSSLSSLLKNEGIEASVYGRPKHIYSIWKKMQKKHLKFSELYDVRAVRVLVSSIEECYAALGVIHSNFEHIAKEFDDYIANPKPNGYQSIHTVVYGEGHKVVEIQIRTKSMHNSAELGVAAHWKYKEGNGQSQGVEERINWLRKLLSWRDDLIKSGALEEEFKNQVFEDRVYIFTPNGEVIDLPTGATPLDFAYHVHTMVGHCCIGAKVDGRIVPYTYKLKTGEQVEIITSKNPNPSRDWINSENGFLKTAKARNKVQSYFRKLDFDRNKELGAGLIEKELVKQGIDISKEQVNSILKLKLSRFNLKSVDDIFANVGAGDIGVNIIIGIISANIEKNKDEVVDSNELIEDLINKRQNDELLKKNKTKSGIIVEGVGDIMTHMAKCCQPIPGDEIVGFVTQGRGISIHRCDCEKFRRMQELFPERVVDATWGSNVNIDSGYTVTVRIVSEDYSGFLRDITTVIANEKMNVLGIKSHVDSAKNVCLVDVDLLVVSIPVLNRTLAKLNDLTRVISAQRV